MSELPEKLTLQIFFDFICKISPKKILNPEETNDCEEIVKRYNAYAGQQVEIERLKIINTDIVYAEYCLGCDSQSNDRARLIKQITDQQAEIITMNDSCVKIRRELEKKIADQQALIKQLKEAILILCRDDIMKANVVINVVIEDALAAAEKLKNDVLDKKG